jgi:2C-methyl-D-erythritol 2,4-cyclodiphosphate synthase
LRLDHAADYLQTSPEGSKKNSRRESTKAGVGVYNLDLQNSNRKVKPKKKMVKKESRSGLKSSVSRVSVTAKGNAGMGNTWKSYGKFRDTDMSHGSE